MRIGWQIYAVPGSAGDGVVCERLRRQLPAGKAEGSDDIRHPVAASVVGKLWCPAGKNGAYPAATCSEATI